LEKKWIVVIILSFSLLTLFWIVKPTGYYYHTPPATLENAVVLLKDPDFNNGFTEWWKTHWSSKDGTETTAQWNLLDSKIQMGTSGYDASFYAVGVGQGYGPDSLWKQPADDRRINVEINNTFHNVVSWIGTVDYAKVLPIGSFGVGLNIWYDVILQNSTKLPFEMNIYFYQQGVTTLPIGSFKNYVRGNFFDSFFEEDVPASWCFFYFHPYQAQVGVESSFTLELSDYVYVAQAEAGEPYSSGRFILTGVNVVLELFMAEGIFTVSYCSLQQAPR